jgi:hypothetical protein
MITLEDDELVVRFPEVHEEAACRIGFQRTLRVPDDGKEYPLPAGLGNFPLRHVDDFAARLPAVLLRRGGVVMPMWQAEAMWVHFAGRSWGYGSGYPFAVKIATGKINAVTGQAWAEPLRREPQDYVVLPRQPWLDGYCFEKGVIRQFVAMRLGQGYTVEEQLTGAAEHGGMQIVAYPMKAEVYERMYRMWPRADYAASPMVNAEASVDMGLAPGGRMTQEIYEDSYGFDAWDRDHASRCFVTILNAAQWQVLTGEAPPSEPISAKQYENCGIPWFDWYAADQKPLAGAPSFKDVQSVVEAAKAKGDGSIADHPAKVTEIRDIGPDGRPVREPGQVREGRF